MIEVAEKELFRFTLNMKLNISNKLDKTIVTSCDLHIDKILSKIARLNGFQVISEEGEKDKAIVKSGNYLTIDPIDGSLGYIEHIDYAIRHGGIDNFLKIDIGPMSDFCLLIGIVEKGAPRFGCCYHYVTKERILLDSETLDNCIIENKKRKYSGKDVCYVGPRRISTQSREILNIGGVGRIVQATLGLKSLYALINNHKNAILIHAEQQSGLWDVLPSAVAARVFGGAILDGNGKNLIYNKYVNIQQVIVIKGERFLQYVKN